MAGDAQTFRIGTGAGFSADRLEPAVDLAERGALDVMVLECLGERTVAFGHRDRMADPTRGYNPHLERRMMALLLPCREAGTVIVTNMGAATGRAAAERTLDVARFRPQGPASGVHRRRRCHGSAPARSAVHGRAGRARQRRPAGGRNERLSRRGRYSPGPGRRCGDRRPAGRSFDVPGAADAAFRLGCRRRAAARPRNAGRTPARMRHASHRRLFRRSGHERRARPGALRLSDRGGCGRRQRRHHQACRDRRLRHDGDREGAASSTRFTTPPAISRRTSPCAISVASRSRNAPAPTG